MKNFKMFKLTWETMDGRIMVSVYETTSVSAAIDMLIADQGASWIGNILSGHLLNTDQTSKRKVL